MKDIVIIGGGPAGLTAAVYAQRSGKSSIVLEKAGFGGQITSSHKIENFPSAVSISGAELADKLTEQAISQGAEVELEEAMSIEKNSDGTFSVVTDFGKYNCKAVIIATGAKHRTLGVPGEEQLIGNGISFCAVCDGAFYSGKDVLVIGGGNSALVEASLLAETAKKVTLVQNLDHLTGEQKVADALLSRDNVEVIYSTVVDSFAGDDELKQVILRSEITGEKTELTPDGVFVAIGLAPDNKAFENITALDSYGYIIATEACTTDTDGIFVAGDCRTKQIRQITTAAADGAVAALTACKYIDSLT